METTSTTSPETTQPKKRNTFLLVICILTFVGSGWGIISSIRSYATADTAATIAGDAVKNAQDQMDQNNTPKFAKDILNSVADISADSIRKSAIFEFISNLLTLFGALLMFNLKKIGFYLYIAGIAILVVAPLMMGKLLGAIGGIFMGLIGIVFIVMYGVNLKYMNKQAPNTNS